MSSKEFGINIHEEWKGMTQPVGLVVEPIVLERLGIYPEKNIAFISHLQRRLESLMEDFLDGEIFFSGVKDFKNFCQVVLGWEDGDLLRQEEFFSKDESKYICVLLDDYGETLVPDWVIPEKKNNDDEHQVQILVQELKIGTPFDDPIKNISGSRSWEATPQQRFERLLKDTKHPIGILWNGISLRLIYAPSGESSGHITFPIEPMITVDGRAMIGALEMLIGPDRLFEAGSTHTRLKTLMEKSRKEQNEVSNRLSEQVLEALWILVRGFDDAEKKANLIGKSFLRDLPIKNPSQIYGGLITVLLRLVFLLYSEDEELMPRDSLFVENYSVSGLASKLRKDRVQYQSAMEDRRGAWGSLLSLFRLIFDGGGQYEDYLPARHGELFDPDIFPFLEGREANTSYKDGCLNSMPLISDDVVEKVLTKLVLLDGQLLSYRSLDVEQIGSVYEGIIGFDVEKVLDESIGIISRLPSQSSPITIVVSSDELLSVDGVKRVKWLKEKTGVDMNFSLKMKKNISNAKDLITLCQALDNRLSPFTPRGLKEGSLILQPSSERRRSGSHYTPRSLTEPVVLEAFRPWLEERNYKPSSEDILNLKVCDPAMGSGAFLVASCRFLANYLVQSWERDGFPDEFDESFEKEIYARRLIAQQCLYGVDKNSFAVNLAKLSLWLVTLNKDLPFTFVDHCLKCGDSLVGYSVNEIEKSLGEVQLSFLGQNRELIKKLSLERLENFGVDNRSDISYDKKKELLDRQIQDCQNLKMVGDLMIAAFFNGKNIKERYEKKNSYLTMFNSIIVNSEDIKSDPFLSKISDNNISFLKPFHWDLEFPEVFNKNRGFDLFIGNPPFAGNSTLVKGYPKGILDWLKMIHPESGGQCDLSAHFFRRSFDLLEQKGIAGLIATNTIFQGDTRNSGLRWICVNGGCIYSAMKRFKWPGSATVIISIIHFTKGLYEGKKILNGNTVEKITAFLQSSGGHEDPKRLNSNAGQSFKGVEATGKGFIFDDSVSSDNETAGIPSPIAMMKYLIDGDKKNQEVIFPYIGGAEVNSDPVHSSHRFIINFGQKKKEECFSEWPEIINLLEKKVKPERLSKGATLKKYPWWLLTRPRPEMTDLLKFHKSVLVTCRHQSNWLVAKLKSNQVFSDALVVFPPKFDIDILFAILQSQFHEIWVRRVGSSLGDGLRYTPSDCFETFPFPKAIYDLINKKIDSSELSLRGIKTLGEECLKLRLEIMLKNKEGLTSTYNRFNNPLEEQKNILELREIHNKINQSIFELYEWSDISNQCGFAPEFIDIDEETILPQKLLSRIENNNLFFESAVQASNFDNEMKSFTGKRISSWRYRWPDKVIEDLINRLFDLNNIFYKKNINNKLPKKNTFKRIKDNNEGGDIQIGLDI